MSLVNCPDCRKVKFHVNDIQKDGFVLMCIYCDRCIYIEHGEAFIRTDHGKVVL